jgi:Flp pilus assembly protein TadG
MLIKLPQPVDAADARSTSRPNLRRGVAAVEFAVIASLLFVVVLGIIEFGRAMMVLELVNNAARQGARVGSLKGSANSDVTTAVTNSLANAGFNGVQTTVSVNGAVADASTALPGDSLTVKVTVPYANVTWLPTSLFLGGKTLGGTIVMRHE